MLEQTKSSPQKIAAVARGLTSSGGSPATAKLFAALMRKHAQMLPGGNQEKLAEQWDKIAEAMLN